MEKVTKVLNYCDKYELILSIGDVLKEFFYYNDINFEARHTFFELLYKNITTERLRQGWYDEKGQPLSNLIKRYIPKDWQKLPKWNDWWSKIVNEVKKMIVTQEIVYWEREVEYFDSEEYREYNWGDSGSCFRQGRLNEIVSHILKWNCQYVRLGLFEFKREDWSYFGRLWVFKFPDCYIATNLYCSFSNKNELYPHILELIMEYNKLDKKDWYYDILQNKPFRWFYWNNDGYIIVPKGTDIDEILDTIANLPLDLKCSHDCSVRLSMRVPKLDSGIVHCRECRIAICSSCGELTYNAFDGHDGALCEDCAYFCEQCGRIIDRDEVHCVSGYYYCDECFRRNWTYCTRCDEVVDLDDAYWVEDYPYCESCFDELFFVCDHCEETYRRNTVNQVKCIDENGNKVIFCQMCADRWTETCQICNRKVHINYMETINDDKKVCVDCYEEGLAC